jgi:hypothetical protein
MFDLLDEVDDLEFDPLEIVLVLSLLISSYSLLLLAGNAYRSCSGHFIPSQRSSMVSKHGQYSMVLKQ